MEIIKTCTYNIRYDNLGDNNWGWAQRCEHILNMIKLEKFDILGVQEALPHQLESLKTIETYNFFGISEMATLIKMNTMVYFTKKRDLIK